MKIGKTWNTLVQEPFFFILGAKMYFYCYEYYEKSRKPLVNSSKFCWL
jgi:hypothetical protein